MTVRVNGSCATRTITITKGGTVIEMMIGSKAAVVNGTPETMDVAPYIEGAGYTQVPLRFVAEHLNAAVSWDVTSRTASVTSQ